MKKEIRIGLLGFGTVGQGVAEVLAAQRETLSKRSGLSLRLSKVLARSYDELPSFCGDALLVKDSVDIINDDDIDIVVELIGGVEPARSWVLQAIKNGKHVVTANKSLLAEEGHDIFQTAVNCGVEIGFEASVAGGIPVIKTLKEGLVANNILSIMGILNGTANYILTRMTEEGASFSEVLSDAQKLGYAEADPTYDVEGIDTAHKLAILMALSYGMQMSLADIVTEGISCISPLDIEFARDFGCRIKLLAISRNHGGHVEARVHPTMVPQDHLLAKIDGAFNAVHLHGDMVGDVLLYGPGAGKLPTASAVVADIVDIARNIDCGSLGRVPSLSCLPRFMEDRAITPLDELSCPYYFRFSALDKPGVLADISGVLARHGISIESVIQKGRVEKGSVSIVMRTHTACERAVCQALQEVDSLEMVSAPTVKIRFLLA